MAAAAIRFVTPSLVNSAATMRLAVRSETSIRWAMSPVSIPVASSVHSRRSWCDRLSSNVDGGLRVLLSSASSNVPSTTRRPSAMVHSGPASASGRAVLGRNPSAPARRASSARLRSSVPDSARILVFGWRALMCRIAATPPSGGMVRSMIATSASQRATNSAASSTYVVWPPTVNSSPHSRVSSRARPCAKSSWSSTMTTTIFVPPALAFIAAMLAATLWSAG